MVRPAIAVRPKPLDQPLRGEPAAEAKPVDHFTGHREIEGSSDLSVGEAGLSVGVLIKE
jgi:hypothetical protein